MDKKSTDLCSIVSFSVCGGLEISLGVLGPKQLSHGNGTG